MKLQRLLAQNAAQHREWLRRRTYSAAPSSANTRETVLRVLTEETRLVRGGYLWVASAHHLRRALQHHLDLQLRRRAEGVARRLTEDPGSALGGWGLQAWWCSLCDRPLLGAERCAECGAPSNRTLLRKLHRLAMARRRGVSWGHDGQLQVAHPSALWLGPAWRRRLESLGFCTVKTRPQLVMRHHAFHPGYQDGNILHPTERRLEAARLAAVAAALRGQVAVDPRGLWSLWRERAAASLPARIGATDTVSRLRQMLAARGAADNAVHPAGDRYFCSKQGGGPGRYCVMKRGHHSSSNRGVIRLVPSDRDPRLLEVQYTCFSAGCRGRMVLGRVRL